jgi:lipoprotein-anchoring transpeptidase ErfK/SrfK
MTARILLILATALTLTAGHASSAPQKAAREKSLSLEQVNNAEWRGKRGGQSAAVLVKLQVLLDRAHASPGEIDATFGSNTRKAVAAYRELKGLSRGERIDEALWRSITETDQRPALKTYTISEADTSGPFLEKVPTDYREKAELPRLGYTSVVEALAEKFHMSEKLLRRLNPEASFDKPGTEIVVPDVQRDGLPRKIARIEIAGTQVRVYDKDKIIVAIYPATVGSAERPSPSGEFKVTAVAENPTYYYDPANNLKGVDVEEKLKLPPGPNNPVGNVWISLSEKGYGIHGTPDPEAVGKRASHGCIRLTNWDALELAKHVQKGTPVTIQSIGPRGR